MADELNGQGLPVRHTEPSKKLSFAILCCMTLTIGPLTNFGLLFPVVCFVFVFDQTLAEHPDTMINNFTLVSRQFGPRSG